MRKKYLNDLLERDTLIVNLNTTKSSLKEDLNSPLVTTARDKSLNKYPLIHLSGNVSEMSSEKGKHFGLSWQSSIDSERTGTYTAPNCWIGFRNVCTWTRWNE